MTEHHGDRRAAPDGDEHFARMAGELLRRSADDIDAATASRLNRARQAALAAMPGRRPGRAWLLPALSTAAVGALAVGLWLNRSPDPGPPAGPAPAVESAADLDLLLAADSLEMLEDLEFYAWLDADLSASELRAELESAG
jgi:hypothetical protein